MKFLCTVSSNVLLGTIKPGVEHKRLLDQTWLSSSIIGQQFVPTFDHLIEPAVDGGGLGVIADDQLLLHG